MDRRAFLKTAAAGVMAAQQAQGETETARPNIVVITTDQQHWQAFGAADPFFETPHIDALAKSGTVFRSAFCTTPQCSASRSSLYTGFYPHTTQVIGNTNAVDHHGKAIAGLPTRFETLGSRLKEGGYHTAYFGKWHLGNKAHFATHFDQSDLDGEAHDGASKSAIRYLRERRAHADRPFALFVNYVNPHDIYAFGRLGRKATIDPPSLDVPHPESWSESFAGKPPCQERFMREDQGAYMYGKPDVFWERYREFYREKCRLVDAQVGKILRELERGGLAEDTLVVFTSDHGDMDTQHRLIYKGPFMYEHMVRVPLMIRTPKQAAPKATEDFAVLTDIMPTLCAFAGLDCADSHGRSLHPFLTGAGTMPEREFVIGQYYNKQKWVNPIRMIRTKSLKYNRYLSHGEEFYDLVNDPHELVNLARDAGYGKRKAALGAELDRWMIDHGDRDFANYWCTNRDGSRYAAPA